MIELTVKTLDSRNHSFSVPDDVTVKQLKEHIADSVNIAADSQRLIYCGRVLQDDKNLSEYDVNGKVIHLVQRAPPVNNGAGPDRGASNNRTTTGPSGARRTQQWRTLFGPGSNTGNTMYLGAMAFPAEIMDASGISMQQPRQCLSQSRLAVVRNMLRRTFSILNRLENPPQDNTEATQENGSTPPEVNNEEDVPVTATPIATVEISPGSFVIGNQQTDAGASNAESQAETPDSNSSASQHEPQAANTSDQNPSQNDNEEGGNNGASRNRVRARTQALVELLDQAAEINTRVQPFMSQYQQLMRDDPVFTDQIAVATNQRLFTCVSEIMHNLAHAYHALSDIMCDFSQPPPRYLRCRPVLIHHSAVVQTGIPIQINTANLGNQQNPSNASSTSSGNGNRPTEQNSEESVNADSTAGSETQQPATSQSDSQSLPDEVSSTSGDNSNGGSGRQPRSPSVSPPRAGRIGPVGAGGPGIEVFVDVAPGGSITIDSLEATVVTNAAPSTSEPNSWQNPPEFVQNLITALAGQFMGATLQQYRFPEQQSGSSNQQATPTSSQQNSSNSQPERTNNTQQNGNAERTNNTQQNGNSQPTVGAQPASSQARSTTATHPTTATQTRSTARPHVHLSPSVQGFNNNSFDPFLPCNSHHIRSRGSRLRPTQAQPQSQPSSNNATSGTAGNPFVIDEVVQIPVPAPAPTQRSVSFSFRPGEAPNVEVQGEGRPNNVNDQRERAPQPALPAELQAIFQTIRNPTAFVSQNPTTLAQVLQNVPGYSYTPGESILTDVFMTLAQSLSFLDMVQLGLGVSDCLVRARPQLQRLISQRLLNGQPYTIAAITGIIERFNNELAPYYSILNNARLREDIDLPATLNLYNHATLPCIVNTVMEEDQSTFHRTLMRKCAQYIRRLCALLQYCCLDGVTGLETILRAFVDQMTTGVPGVLQEWTMSHSIINFRTFISSLNVSSEDIEPFLTYRMSGQATSPLPATTPAAEPMETQDIDDVQESTPSLIREPPVADVPPTQHINEVIGWQNAIPSEWVPIITRDSQRQRRQNPQGPFSDAYLSGMPSKRRKLITSAKPQGNLSQVISESMATALGAAGMSSGPEVDVIAQRAGQDNSLRAAYREQVRTTVCQNLNSNPDYVPEKYPNTTKYFKKQ